MFVKYSLRVPKRCLFLRLKNYFCGRILSLRLMTCLKPKRRERENVREVRERNGCKSKMISIPLHDKNFHHLSH